MHDVTLTVSRRRGRGWEASAPELAPGGVISDPTQDALAALLTALASLVCSTGQSEEIRITFNR